MHKEFCVICGKEIGERAGKFVLIDPELWDGDDMYFCEMHTAALMVSIIRQSPFLTAVLTENKGVFPNVEKMVGLDDGN